MSSDEVRRSGVTATTAGRKWEEQPVGLRLRTLARTLTESDLMTFVTLAGLFEPLFLDARDETYRADRRVVPGVLTFAIAEGLVIQTQMFQGTGLAMLRTELSAVGPVFVGDTVDVEIEVIESRSTSKDARGVVVTRNRVFNQDDRLVLEYTTTRLIAGRGSA